MNADRRLAFERARRPMAVAMRVVAAALAVVDPPAGARRSVFIGPRTSRRVAIRDTTLVKAQMLPRGCEDLH
jgi:hypothetical protein